MKTGSNALQLALSENLGELLDDGSRKVVVSSTSTGKFASVTIEETIDVTSNDQIKKGVVTNVVYNTIALATSSGADATTNDSLKIVYGLTEKVIDETNGVVAGDTLTLWNQHVPEDSSTPKEINLPEEYLVSNLSSGLGTSKGDELTVNGVDTGSTVDMNHKTGFVVKGETTLTINDVTFTNINDSAGGLINNSADGTVNLNNVVIGDEDTSYSNSVIKNAGALVFDGKSTIYSGITGSGKTTIVGELVANATIAQAIEIDGGTLTIDASNIGKAVTNDNSLVLTGGTLAYKVSGDGTTKIDGQVTNNKVIDQAVEVTENGKLTVNANIGDLTNLGSVTANANNLTGEITNDNILTIIGGTINTEIESNNSDAKTIIDGKVTNNAAISQTVEVTSKGNFTVKAEIGNLINNGTATVNAEIGDLTNNGTVTANADNLTGSITNDKTLTINGGTIASEIKTTVTDGSTVIDGEVIAEAKINQSIRIKSGANKQLTISASDIGGSVTNDKALILTEGELSQTISGTGQTYVGDDETITLVDGAGISQVVNMVSGAIIVDASDNVSIQSILGDSDEGYGDLTVSSGKVTIGKTEVNELTNDGELTITNGLIANSITNNETLSITGTTTVTDEILNDGEMTIGGDASANSITNNDTLKITGKATVTEEILNDGEMTIGGGVSANSITNNEKLEITGNTTVKELTNDGEMTIIGEVIATTITNGENNSDASLTITGNVNSGEVNNYGEMTVIGTLNVTNTITNSGDLSVVGEVIANDIENTGTVTVDKGAVVSATGNVIVNNDYVNEGETKIAGKLTVTGAIENSTDSTLEVTGAISGASLENEGAVSGGSLTITDAIANATDSTLDITGDISGGSLENEGTVNGASLAITGDITNAEDCEITITGAISGASLENEGAVSGESLTVTEAIVNATDSTLDITGAISGGSLENDGTVNGASLAIEGDITNAEDCEITIDGAISAENLTNEGSVTGSSLTVTDAIVNATDSKLDIEGAISGGSLANEGTVNGASLAIEGDITNGEDCEITITGAISGASLENEGAVSGGSLTITDAIVNATDSTLDITGDISGGSLTNDGTVNGASLAITGDITNAEDCEITITGDISGGSLENEGTVNGASLAITGDITNAEDCEITIDGAISAKNLTNEGSVTGSSLTVTDAIVNATDSKLDIEGAISGGSLENEGTVNGASLAITGDITNGEDCEITIDGAISAENLTNGGSVTGSSLTITDAIANATDSTLDIEGAISGGSLTNDGTVNGASLAITGDITNAEDCEITIDGAISAENLTNEGSVTGSSLTVTDAIVNATDSKLDIEGAISGGSLANEGTVNGASLAIEGDITNGEDCEITITGDISGGSLENEGTVNGASLAITGDITNAEDCEITIDGAISAENLTNEGSVTGESLTVTDAIVNATDSKLDIEGAISGGSLENEGTVNGASLAITGDAVNDSAGTIDIDNAIKVNNLTNYNTITAGSLTAVGDIENADNAEITSGNLSAKNVTNGTGSTLDVDGTTTVSDSFVNDGTATLNGNVTAKSITNSADMDITGKTKADTLVNTGNFDAEGDVYILTINNSSNIKTKNSTFTTNSITSDSTGVIFMESTVFNPKTLVKNQSISAKDSTINVAHDPYLMVNDSVKLDKSVMNLGNLTTQELVFADLTLDNGSKINIKSSVVDYEKEVMGRIVATGSAISASADSVINLGSIKLVNISDKYVPNGIMRVNFINQDLAQIVNYTGLKDALTPIWKYGIEYDYNTGDVVLAQGGRYNPKTQKVDYPNNPSDRYNPAVLASPVAAQLGGYLGMIDTYDNSFTHLDMNMLKPLNKRMAELHANMLATANSSDISYLVTEANRAGAWYKPYGNYDSVRLKRGPKVHNFTYGSFVGGDSETVKLNNGFYGVFSPYVSYLGSHQSYAGNSIWQNGGTLGATGSFYKGNFFTGVTIGAGASVAEVSSMYGHDSFPMLMAGIASRTGYNFEFKEGKFIVQPSMQLSYTMVNAFDYTNAAGVRIDADPMHAIQVAPNLKLIMNTKNNWSPYAVFGMNWNIMDKTNFNAEIYELPQMTVKPYFLYGLGIQKTVQDRFTGAGQLVLRNGGRTGVGFAFGFRYAVGKGKKSTSTKTSKNETKTIIKQLCLHNKKG